MGRAEHHSAEKEPEKYDVDDLKIRGYLKATLL